MIPVIYFCILIGGVIITILSVYQLIRIADGVTHIADYLEKKSQ